MSPDGPHPNVWHPFSAIEGMRALPRVVAARGSRLELADGRSLLDCISSWWVNLHGHGHPVIADAIHDQARRLEHVLFAGFTHEPAERLAEALVAALPPGLTRVFYSDDGSTSVEVALKIAVQYWRNRGEDRPAFVAFEGAYHGDTFGAMSVGSRSLFTSAFEGLLFRVERIPFPDTWFGDEDVERREAQALRRLDAVIEGNAGRIAAILVEPLVQGAGGMRMCREGFLRELARAAREHGILLILDEVMTGFGRTGEWFAATRAGVEPDLICLAKGLTGGFVPLAATVATEELYQGFRGADPGRTLWHGHSYTANPIGCAAALASVRLMHEAEPVFRKMEAHHRAFLNGLEAPCVRRRRATGTIAAFDLELGEPSGYLNRIGGVVRELALERGLLLRPLGNTVYVLPPYSLTAEEREHMYSGIRGVVSALA